MQQVTAQPEQIFRAVVIMHVVFVFAAIMYVIVGEVINWSDPAFEGYVITPGDSTNLALRLVFLLVAVMDAFLVFGLFGREAFLDRRTLDRAGKLSTEPDSTAVAMSLQTRQISCDAWASMVATFGLILYLLGGERIDLYGFCGAAIVAFLLNWPRRTHWENTFRRLAQRYPGVPSDPWHPSLAGD